MSENKLNLKQIIAIGIFTGIGSVAGKFAYDYFTSGSITGQPTIERVLMQTANQVNQNLPILLDKYTRLDSTIATGGNKFRYDYTLLNVNMETLDIAQLEQTMRPKLINQYQSNQEMKSFRDMEVELTYSYFSEAGNELISITLSPDDFTEN